MPQFIYNESGQTVGFIHDNYIHDMNGDAVGQLEGTHVHKLSGEYVAELYEDMIVETYANYGNIRSAKNPGRLSVPRHPGTRGIINYGYPDASAKLFR